MSDPRGNCLMRLSHHTIKRHLSDWDYSQDKCRLLHLMSMPLPHMEDHWFLRLVVALNYHPTAISRRVRYRTIMYTQKKCKDRVRSLSLTTAVYNSGVSIAKESVGGWNIIRRMR
jgi:hypothetical protein